MDLVSIPNWLIALAAVGACATGIYNAFQNRLQIRYARERAMVNDEAHVASSYAVERVRQAIAIEAARTAEHHGILPQDRAPGAVRAEE